MQSERERERKRERERERKREGGKEGKREIDCEILRLRNKERETDTKLQPYRDR